MTHPDDLLSVPDVAAMKGVKLDTISAEASRRQMPPVWRRYGRAKVWRRSTIEAWLAERGLEPAELPATKRRRPRSTDQLVTVAQAADMAGIEPSSMRRYLQAGLNINPPPPEPAWHFGSLDGEPRRSSVPVWRRRDIERWLCSRPGAIASEHRAAAQAVQLVADMSRLAREGEAQEGAAPFAWGAAQAVVTLDDLIGRARAIQAGRPLGLAPGAGIEVDRVVVPPDL
jgi:predicted DNA-binding transcriptional regulator AlpA